MTREQLCKLLRVTLDEFVTSKSNENYFVALHANVIIELFKSLFDISPASLVESLDKHRYKIFGRTISIVPWATAETLFIVL